MKDAAKEGATPPAQDAGGSAIGENEAIEGLEKMVVTDEESGEPTETEGEETPPTEEQSTEEESVEEADDPEDGDDEEGESESDEDDAEEPKAHQGQRAEKRIHKLTAQRNEAREKAEAAEKAAESYKAVAEANLQLQPEYLSKGEAEVIARANQMIERKEWLMGHIGVGYEDEKDDSKSLTPKQIAEELVKIDRQWDLVADARRTYDERKKQQLEDMKAGRMLRLSKAAMAKNKNSAKAPAVKSAASAAQTATRSVAKAAPSRRGMNEERFRKAGATEDAAIRELEELIAI